MSDVPVGALIDGRYRVVSRLGSGGMADVFMAQDQQLGRSVALKLLHRRFAEDAGFVERFRREAQAAAGLQHPNVVGVYDRGDFDGTYYIAMEHLTGRSLKQLIRQEAPVAPVRAIDITLQILKAARFAHRHGVIHRDLKPHNVIVDESGHVKVTDFGIARAGASDMTETGSIMGTAQYLSPEQAQGHAVSETSDLYSVGVILYELLTGRVPFDAESAVTIALKHVSEAPMPPTQVNPAIPPVLEEVVMWTLNKSPAHRPGNADELIGALEAARAAILSGQAGERTAAMAAVGGGGVPFGGVGLVDPAGTDVASTTQPPVAPLPLGADGGPLDGHQDTGEVPQTRRRKRWPWVLGVLLVLLLLGGGGFAAWYYLIRQPLLTVPPVVGEQLNVARTVLENAGFRVSVTPEASRKPVGQVIGEIPNGGSQVKQGSTISLATSSGPGAVPVPSQLVDDTLPQAERALRAGHLQVGPIVLQSSSQFAPGHVITTSPQPGLSAPLGSKVKIFVSTGIVVPNVRGESEAQAKSDLHNSGFGQITTTLQTSSQASGTVLSQSPTAGTHVLPSNTTVSLVVARAVPMVTVPSVTGEKAGQASKQLHSAGFSVVEQTRTVANKHRNGVVVRQAPAAGASVRRGTTVIIVIGMYSAPTTTTTTTTTPTTTTTATKPGP